MDCIDELKRLFETQGAAAYVGERVSQREHALQTAYLALCAKAPETLVAAALLHDLGHMLGRDSFNEDVVNNRHEERAAEWLLHHFGLAVSEPVRLHVTAKRYLCTVDPSYVLQLSPASIRSLDLQGGRLSRDRIQQFEDNPFHKDAIRLRRWDDAAKVPSLVVEEFETYMALLRLNIISAHQGPRPSYRH